MTGSEKKIENSSNTGWASCRGGGHPQTFTAHRRAEKSHVEYTGTTQVTISIDDDGRFAIASVGPEGQPVGETQILTADERNDGCGGAKPAKTRSMTGTYRPGDWASISTGRSIWRIAMR